MPMKARLAAALFALLPVGALADEAKELTGHLGKAVGAFEAARLYGEQCDRRDPPGAERRKDLLAVWRHENSGADYERVMKGLVRQLPDLAGQIDSQSTRLAELIGKDIESNPDQCRDFGKVLEDPQFDVKSHVRGMLSVSRRLNIDIPDIAEVAPRTRTVEETSILRLAALSARLEGKMAEIGSREGAREFTALRRARQDHAEAWLKADGTQVLFGRVTGAEELREWRGDRQSSFRVECHSFAEDAFEARMAGSIGKDMVLVGTPRWVADAADGGRVSLSRCSLFTVEETARPFAEEADEAGLVLRPLAFEEAFAGAGRGIETGDVDRVLYASRFATRMDGFGNGYVDRGEEIYVLLRDGTAYRHEWHFPFTDFAAALSRKREPELWFRWSEKSGKVTVTATGGPDQGKTIDLSEAQHLRPLKARTLEGDYRYLQIGMGGARQDRRFAFSRDGTVVYSRGGFVAGNVATGYMIVNGSDEKEKTARYRIEDHALVLETPQGEERHFLAVPETAKGSPPDTLLIDGTAFWPEKE